LSNFLESIHCPISSWEVGQLCYIHSFSPILNVHNCPTPWGSFLFFLEFINCLIWSSSPIVQLQEGSGGQRHWAWTIYQCAGRPIKKLWCHWNGLSKGHKGSFINTTL
jgi:hypothetical protein